MGRTFLSIRQGINEIANRWAQSSRWLKKPDQKYGELLVQYTKTYSSEAFDACQDPLEGAVFSALVGIIKRQEQLEERLEQKIGLSSIVY
jgi:hypothetical protein